MGENTCYKSKENNITVDVRVESCNLTITLWFDVLGGVLSER